VDTYKRLLVILPALAIGIDAGIRAYLSSGGLDMHVHGSPILASALTVIGTLFVNSLKGPSGKDDNTK
jgi:hypothetical protein